MKVLIILELLPRSIILVPWCSDSKIVYIRCLLAANLFHKKNKKWINTNVVQTSSNTSTSSSSSSYLQPRPSGAASCSPSPRLCGWGRSGGSSAAPPPGPGLRPPPPHAAPAPSCLSLGGRRDERCLATTPNTRATPGGSEAAQCVTLLLAAL